MNFEQMKETFLHFILDKQLVSATFSQPRQKSNELKRVKLKPVEIKKTYCIQFEYQYERILKHENISLEDFEQHFNHLLSEFRQIYAQFLNETVQIKLSKKNKVFWKSEKTKEAVQVNLSHNRQKQYLLDESKPHPFLIRLGVQTEDGKIVKSKHAKFRQINRFLEFIDDALEFLPKNKQIRIIDFGSGKSYLTFAMYHYLKNEKKALNRVGGSD